MRLNNTLLHRLYLVLIVFFLTIIFIIDYLFAAEIFIGALYIFPIVFAGFLLPEKKIITLIACLASVFTLIDFIFFSQQATTWQNMANEGIYLFVVWATTFICYFGLSLKKSANAFQQQFQVALESAPTGMIITDDKGKIKIINRQAEILFGYSKEEIINQKIEILVPKEIKKDHVDYRKAFFKKPEARLMGSGRELFGLKKNGQKFPVEIGLNPIQNNKQTLVISSIIDITQRKEDRKKVLQANEKLKQTNQELEQFAHMASHDLQEPLRKIIAFSDFLKEGYQDQLDDQGKKYIQIMQDSSNRMSTLIDDILDYSRTGWQQEKNELVDLNEVTDEVILYLKDSIDQAKATIKVDKLNQINGNKTGLKRLFQNLLENSIKYREKNRPLQITISQTIQNNQIHLSFKDNGIGFDEKYLEKMLSPFGRLHSRSQYPGSGIGLALCKKIVQLHHGKLQAHGVLGQGSKFVVSLPK